MNLLVDSGNSFIKWALATDASLVTESYHLSNALSSLHDAWECCDVPDRVIVSNVAGESSASEISKAASALWQLDAEFVVTGKSCCGLTNSYSKPEQLGVDRWMAMVAACRMIDGAVIIVDCGTAVTIDLVNEDRLFLGGVIMPGLGTAFQSLKYETDAVEEININTAIVSPVAHSTEDGVVAGVLLGLAGGIERVVREQSSSIDNAPAVFITGGDAEKLIPYLTIAVSHQVNLVLQGLRIIAARD